MKGLQAEFERFRQIALVDAPATAIRSLELIYMAGAMAASARILDVLDADMPLKRKCALMRRVSRECSAFQMEMQETAFNPPAEEPPNV